MITFYDFVDDWEANCEECPHCGSTSPLDQDGHYHGEESCDHTVYTEEIIEAYLEEVVA